MDEDELIRKLQFMLTDVALYDAKTPEQAGWQSDFLDVITLNIEILRGFRDENGR